MIPRMMPPVTKRMAVGEVCLGLTSADLTIDPQGMDRGRAGKSGEPSGWLPSTTSRSSGAPQFRQRIEFA
jgi:hypothetical protein